MARRDPEATKAYNREYMRRKYQADPEAGAARARAQRANDPDYRTKKSAYNKRYRAENRAELVARSREHYQINRVKHSALGLKARYGLSLEQVSAMHALQEGKCAICARALLLPPVRRDERANAAHVDHCHVTGKVRGLLCSSCNTALGLFRESESALEAATQYLKRHRAN